MTQHPHQLHFLTVVHADGHRSAELVLHEDLHFVAGSRLRLVPHGGAVAATVLVDLPKPPAAEATT